MNLSQLYYFRKLAQLQHYTKASKELYITQPSLSDSISALEKELGVSLFRKHGRNIKLTDHGEKFYKFVCNSLNELEKGIDTIKMDSNIIKGTIDLGCIPTLCGDFLPRAIKGFSKDMHSKAKFNIHQGMTLSVIDGIKSGKYDLGFCSKVDNEPDLIFIPVIAQELVLLVNKEHPLSTFKYLSLNELSDYPIITYRDTISIGKTIKKLLIENSLSASFSFDDEISIGGIISEASMINGKPTVAIAANTPLLRQFDNIKHIKLNIPSDTRLVYMVYNKNNYFTKLSENFANYIVAKEMNLP